MVTFQVQGREHHRGEIRRRNERPLHQLRPMGLPHEAPESPIKGSSAEPWLFGIWLTFSVCITTYIYTLYIYIYGCCAKGPCLECSIRLVCQNDLWRKLKAEFAKVNFSLAKVSRK